MEISTFLYIPIFAFTAFVLTLTIAYANYDINSVTFHKLATVAGVFAGVFASSISNYIQSIEIENNQAKIIATMPIGKILTILQDKKKLEETAQKDARKKMTSVY